jgi:hypothetical protein
MRKYVITTKKRWFYFLVYYTAFLVLFFSQNYKLKGILSKTDS